MNLDSVQNLLTAAKSTVDPVAGNIVVNTKRHNIPKWYMNGGIASSIVDFWPNLVGSGIVLTPNDNTPKTKIKAVNNLIEYLNNRYIEINLLDTLIDIHTQAHILSKGVGLISIQNNKIIDTELIVNCDYEIVNDNQYKVNGVIIPKELLLIYKGKSSYTDDKTYPIIDLDTVEACLLYEQAIKSAATILQKKNTVEMGIEGFNENMLKDTNGEYSKRIVSLISKVQQTGNILNVNIHDKNETIISILERSLANVHDVVDRLRDYIVATSNNIPEAKIFGSNRVGGLSKSNDDTFYTNIEANRIFNRKWVRLTKQVNSVLLNESDCPSGDVVNYINISRVGYNKIEEESVDSIDESKAT